MDADFLKLVEQATPRRPVAYNRRWHLDEDDRRHHGQRTWESVALEEIVSLAAQVQWVYPPDWSDPLAVRFRTKGSPEPLAEVFTDSPEHLRVVTPDRQLVVTTAEQVKHPAFAEPFLAALRR